MSLRDVDRVILEVLHGMCRRQGARHHDHCSWHDNKAREVEALLSAQDEAEQGCQWPKCATHPEGCQRAEHCAANEARHDALFPVEQQPVEQEPDTGGQIREILEQAHMAGQADAGVDPGYSNAREWVSKNANRLIGLTPTEQPIEQAGEQIPDEETVKAAWAIYTGKNKYSWPNAWREACHRVERGVLEVGPAPEPVSPAPEQTRMVLQREHFTSLEAQLAHDEVVEKLSELLRLVGAYKEALLTNRMGDHPAGPKRLLCLDAHNKARKALFTYAAEIDTTRENG